MNKLYTTLIKLEKDNKRRKNELFFTKKLQYIKTTLKKWSIINETLCNKQLYSTVSHVFSLDNRQVTYPVIIADQFNGYFVNIGPSLSNQLQASGSYSKYITNRTHHRLRFTKVTKYYFKYY